MKHLLLIFCTLFLMIIPDLLGVASTQNVTYTISAINSLSISGNPQKLTVSSATAGSQPKATSDSSTTYSITTNNSAQRISASINTTMPNGVTLSMQLAAPKGASSVGNIPLKTSAQNFVTGISRLVQSNLSITYNLSATVAAAPQGPLTRTITFTLGP